MYLYCFLSQGDLPMPKQTPLKKRLRKGVFQIVKNAWWTEASERLPTQFERKGAIRNITHREESHAFRDRIPNISVHQFKRSFEKMEISYRTNHYVTKCSKNDLLFPTRKGNHIKGYARDYESHNIWSTHGFTPV